MVSDSQEGHDVGVMVGGGGLTNLNVHFCHQPSLQNTVQNKQSIVTQIKKNWIKIVI